MADIRRARYHESSSMYGSFDDSSLPSSMRDWESEKLLGEQEDPGAYSDSEQIAPLADEFAEYGTLGSSKGTGRLRKKIASRGKGGAFVEKKLKRRIYSCCIGSEVDTVKLHEYLDELPSDSAPLRSKWTSELYTDTLHVSRKLGNTEMVVPLPSRQEPDRSTVVTRRAFQSTTPEGKGEPQEDKESLISSNNAGRFSAKFNFSAVKEVFVFEFGAVVFWGFSVGEEKDMLKLLRNFVSEELSVEESVTISADDMAFSLVPDDSEIAIVSDILYLPENTITKQRLAMSFALGQSTVLGLFESQVETKIPQYNHIPMTLATAGQIRHMTSSDVGKLIGELFVIRHKLNLHSDILDIPDFFWEEDRFEPEYKNVWKYLEMDNRVTVLNKRLDLIKDMLDLLQFHVERSEMTTLDWIVIVLILMCCFVNVAVIYI